MSRWFILRTSGPQTLAVARSLGEAGFAVWTPARTIRKKLRGPRNSVRQIDVDLPILPTFVFARERELDALAAITRLPFSPHPAFSIFTYAGRVPDIADRDIAGLRAEEAREAATMQAIRDAETHAEAERIRIAAIKSEGLRRRAERAAERAARQQRLDYLRAHQRPVAPGDEVTIAEMPAFVGVTGVVEAIDGSSAEVRFGLRSLKIEGWRLMPAPLDTIAA